MSSDRPYGLSSALLERSGGLELLHKYKMDKNNQSFVYENSGFYNVNMVHEPIQSSASSSFQPTMSSPPY